MIEVHEVHDWPERVVRGPSIVVWFGRNESEAQAALDRLKQRETGTFYYEFVRPDA